MALLIFPAHILATTIVGIWTKKQIIVAADSKQIVMLQNSQIVESQSGCKVFVVRNLVVALAGLAQAEQVSVVDSIRNSRELVELGTNVKLPELSLEVAAESAVSKVLQKRRMVRDPNVPVQLIVAGMISGKLKMVRFETVGMQIAGNVALPTSTSRIVFPDNRGNDGSYPNRAMAMIGIGNAISRFQRVYPDWNKGDDITVARLLVAVEASDAVSSQFVGAPISTIVVNKKGVRWVDRGVCQENPPEGSGVR